MYLEGKHLFKFLDSNNLFTNNESHSDSYWIFIQKQQGKLIVQRVLKNEEIHFSYADQTTLACFVYGESRQKLLSFLASMWIAFVPWRLQSNNNTYCNDKILWLVSYLFMERDCVLQASFTGCCACYMQVIILRPYIWILWYNQ